MPTTRNSPVVDFPSGLLSDVLQTLRGVLGRLTSLLVVPLFIDRAGFAIAAGATTTLSVSATTIDLGDAGVDQVRAEVYGITSAGAGIAVVIYDLTNARELCRVLFTTVLGARVGAWTRFKPIGGDAVIVAQVIGNGSATQTVHQVRLQARTTRAAA